MRKVFLVHPSFTSVDLNTDDKAQGAYVRKLFEQGDVSLVILMDYGIDLTVGQVRIMERMLRQVFREPVVVSF